MRKDHVLFSIASVLLLLGTGIGVVVFNHPRNTPPSTNALDTTRAYEVTWKTTSLEPTNINGFVGRDAEYVTTISFSQPNLNDLHFILSWIDDKATVLNHCGLDTLTLQITCPDGSTFQDAAKSAPRTKQGLVEIVIPLETERLTPMTLYSSDVSEATFQVQESFDTTWVNRPFTIRISDQVGELRPLKRLRDKGNDFELEIIPEVVTASIVDLTSTALDTNDTQGNPDNSNETTDPLLAGIKAGPLQGYAPLAVHFYANPENDSRIASYDWTFGPTTAAIVPEANYRTPRSLILLFFLPLFYINPPLFLLFLASYSLYFARLMRKASLYESTDRAPTMVFVSTGNYWATLTVADAQGHTVSDTVWITVLQYVYPDHDHTT